MIAAAPLGMRQAIARAATSLPFRIAIAMAFVGAHLYLFTEMGAERFKTSWNMAPGDPPAFADSKREADAHRWNRLSVSRWDSGHYIALALRGYTACPQKLPPGTDLGPILPTCNLAFYPGYPALGYVASLGERIPIDFALLGISLSASFATMLMWTSRTITRALGVGPTYVALLLFNVFPPASSLVMIFTEPPLIALSLGAFLAFEKRWLLFGALLAGLATAMRVSGVATGLAYAFAVLVLTLREPPRGVTSWLERGAAMAGAGWGVIAIMAYFRRRFGDPLIYFHAHEAHFHHQPSFTSDPEPMLRALDHPLHDAWWLVIAIIFFFVGRKRAMARFDVPARCYWYMYTLVLVAVPVLGTFNIAYAGMSRYLLPAIPLFFAMSVTLSRRPLLLVAWVLFSAWSYWQVDACFLSAGPGPHGLAACHDTHWIGRI